MAARSGAVASSIGWARSTTAEWPAVPASARQSSSTISSQREPFVLGAAERGDTGPVCDHLGQGRARRAHPGRRALPSGSGQASGGRLRRGGAGDSEPSRRRSPPAGVGPGSARQSGLVPTIGGPPWRCAIRAVEVAVISVSRHGGRAHLGEVAEPAGGKAPPRTTTSRAPGPVDLASFGVQRIGQRQVASGAAGMKYGQPFAPFRQRGGGRPAAGRRKAVQPAHPLGAVGRRRRAARRPGSGRKPAGPSRAG